MSNNFAESVLYNCIGSFSTLGQVITENVNTNIPGDSIDYQANSIKDSIFPGQCQAFLTTSIEFFLFVEEREIIYPPANSPIGTPLASFGNKKVYPVKVTGLNLPLIRNQVSFSNSVSVRWRDELIRHSNIQTNFDTSNSIGNFRPGFGETIISDLQRPLKSATIQTNNLGLPNLQSPTSSILENGLTGPLGRLMSIASYVDPELAKKYDASKKKKKSLNEQTYQDIPTYPAYTPYQNNGGY